MTSSTVPAASAATGDNYVLISSVTPTAASSTLSFTGISGYRKLLLKTFQPGLSATSTITLTFNGDTGANYAYQAVTYTSSSGAATSVYRSGNATGIAIPSLVSGALEQNLIINDTNTAGIKTFNGFFYNGGPANAAYPALQGMYFASAAITSVTLTVTTNTFAASGTVALYGVAS